MAVILAARVTVVGVAVVMVISEALFVMLAVAVAVAVIVAFELHSWGLLGAPGPLPAGTATLWRGATAAE